MDKQTAFPKRQIVDIETWERKDNFNFPFSFIRMGHKTSTVSKYIICPSSSTLKRNSLISFAARKMAYK